MCRGDSIYGGRSFYVRESSLLSLAGSGRIDLDRGAGPPPRGDFEVNLIYGPYD